MTRAELDEIDRCARLLLRLTEKARGLAPALPEVEGLGNAPSGGMSVSCGRCGATWAIPTGPMPSSFTCPTCALIIGGVAS